MSRPRSVGALALALAVCSLARCGGGSKETASASASAPDSTLPAAAPSAAPAPPVEADDAASRTRRPAGGSRPVLWIGMDGLDFEMLDRLSAEGKMPNWKRLAAEGYTTRITSFVPILSPVVWTTVATGVGPDVHRVLDFQEVDPKTGQKVPVSGLSRAAPAVWNFASAAGRSVGVVGWWATHPAEEVKGFFISDHASPILYEKLPLSGVAFPASLAPGVAQVVARDGRVSESDLAPFVDAPASEISQALASGQGMENRYVALARILSATRVYQRAARDLYDKQLPDLMMLYLEGTDEIGHVFAPDTPPKLSCESDADFARYQKAAAVYYSVVDRMLGQWMRRAEEDGATLIVQSDHGFKWGADRPCERSSLNWSTAAYWHRIEGVFAAWGARVKPGKGSAAKPTMLDPAPTVLALLGLPADKRMSGHPIAAAFTDLKAPARSDLASGLTVRRVPAEAMSEAEKSEYTKKLLALGYLSGSEAKPLAPTGGDKPGMTEGAWNNLGLYERETVGDFTAARAAFEKSLELRPGYHSPMFNLAILYRQQKDFAKAREWLFKSFAAGHADPEGTLLGWVNWYEDHGNREQVVPLLEAAVHESPGSEVYARALGLYRFRRKDCPGAWDAVAPFAGKTSDPTTLNTAALVQTCLGRRDDAILLLEKSLSLNPDQPGAVQSLKILRGAPAKGN
ncbi:MAG TPA: alkaline phosphatase family protein [Thermoanaerobaculia bacterium]|nr:alkaline phosphatase family protein [Thermoanaerobaculia bacterium]